MERKWWKEAVGYQIYPRSFKDTTGNGIGDLRGIIEKLEYLETLGIDLIWICPFYKSPMDDNGYDVSDYYDIDPLFGTLDDIKELIEKAHKKGIRIVADLVLNHTSDEHPWFIEASKSKDNKYRDFYIWADGKDGCEPTNWASFFGGSAWEYSEKTGDYFMKIFSNKMPDLNWKNGELRKQMYEMTNWWLELGIDGFRVDAIAHLGRKDLVDAVGSERYVEDWSKFSNLPIVHDYLKEFRKETIDNYDVFTVGEVGGNPSTEDILKYSGYKENELNMAFVFDHNWCNNGFDINDINKLETDIHQLRFAFNKVQGLYGKAWNPLYWLNHDHPRVLSIYGSKEHHNKSGKMLATLLYFMWGTPFIYNGEEIGMINYEFTDITQCRDVGTLNRYKLEVLQGDLSEVDFIGECNVRSRDHARSPMQWDASENAGFTVGIPWINVHPSYKEINVESQLKDEDSLLNYYRRIIELRKNSQYKDLIVYGKPEMILTDHDDVIAYTREYENRKLLIVANMFNRETRIDLDYKVINTIISNNNSNVTNLSSLTIEPFTSFVLEIK